MEAAFAHTRIAFPWLFALPLRFRYGLQRQRIIADTQAMLYTLCNMWDADQDTTLTSLEDDGLLTPALAHKLRAVTIDPGISYQMIAASYQSIFHTNFWQWGANPLLQVRFDYLCKLSIPATLSAQPELRGRNELLVEYLPNKQQFKLVGLEWID